MAQRVTSSVELRSMKAKTLQERIHEGWTVEDFTEYYHCSEEELKRHIHQIYSKSGKKADDTWKEIESNEKIRRKSSKPVSATGSQGGKQTTPQAPEETPMEAENDASVAFQNQNDTLRAREKELSEQVVALEIQWQDEKRARKECLRQLRELQKELEEMRRAINSQYEECKTIIENSNQCAERMNANLETRNKLREQLDDIRAELKRRSKLLLGLTIEGEVLTLEEFGWELDDSGFEEIFHEIVESDACAELKLKEIRALARLIAIARNEPVPIEVIFDNSDAELAYQAIKASEQNASESRDE